MIMAAALWSEPHDLAVMLMNANMWAAIEVIAK